LQLHPETLTIARHMVHAHAFAHNTTHVHTSSPLYVTTDSGSTL
jgi:hypothetical protein